MVRHVTVVTGGSRGICAATFRRLADAGHDVVLGHRRAADAAEATAEAVRATGANCVTVQMDTGGAAAARLRGRRHGLPALREARCA